MICKRVSKPRRPKNTQTLKYSWGVEKSGQHMAGPAPAWSLAPCTAPRTRGPKFFQNSDPCFGTRPFVFLELIEYSFFGAKGLSLGAGALEGQKRAHLHPKGLVPGGGASAPTKRVEFRKKVLGSVVPNKRFWMAAGYLGSPIPPPATLNFYPYVCKEILRARQL